MSDVAELSELALRPPFEHHGGMLWRADLPPGFAGPGDSSGAPAASRLRLFEDGIWLGPAHSGHADIARAGRGRYSHWHGTLWFSTRDGSDPNANGRRYAASIGAATLKLLGFGTCHLGAALVDLHERGAAYNLWNDPEPTASPRETLQLVELQLGRLEVPRALKALALSNGRASSLAGVLRGADVAFLEFGTLIDIAYGPYWIPRAKLSTDLLDRFSALGRAEGRIAKRWYHLGLVRQNEAARRELSGQMLELLPRTGLDPILARDVIERARGDLQDPDEAADTIARIRDGLGTRAVCVLSANNAFMPDGRPVSWPRNFAKDLEPICRRLGLPLLHPHRLVAEHGVAFSLMPEKNLHHFTPQFLSRLGDEMLAMARGALGGR